jgi:hypothetical protein
MGTEDIKECVLSCHNNMKFLHNIAEVSHGQKMEYLFVFALSTTSGYFEAESQNS